MLIQIEQQVFLNSLELRRHVIFLTILNTFIFIIEDF